MSDFSNSPDMNDINEILNTARDIMRDEGVASLTLQKIAQRVGMKSTSLYSLLFHYFPDVNAIYDELFAMGMRQYREDFESIFNEYGATWEGLQRIMEAYVSYAVQNREIYQIMFERPVPSFFPSPEAIEESAKLVAVAQHVFAKAKESGAINSDLTVEDITNLFVSIMHGISAMHIANDPDLPVYEGRFGSLLPSITEILKNAWEDKSG